MPSAIHLPDLLELESRSIKRSFGGNEGYFHIMELAAQIGRQHTDSWCAERAPCAYGTYGGTGCISALVKRAYVFSVAAE